MLRRTFVVIVTALAAAPLFSGTYIVPPAADMIRGADAIAIVTIQSSHSYFTDDGSIATDHHAVIEQSLKSSLRAASRIVVTQRGGVVGDLALAVSTEPRFVAGERTLLLLSRLGAERFTTYSGELGKFNFVTDAESRQLLVRGAGERAILGWDFAGRTYTDRPREAGAFLRFIERVVAGENPEHDGTIEGITDKPVATDSHVPGTDYCTLFAFPTATRATRWPTGSFSTVSVGTQTGVNLSAGIGAARGAWNSAPGATINIGYSGTGTGGTYGNNDGSNRMFFDQPDSGPLAGNVVGQANLWATSATNTNGADTYWTSVDCDIVIQVGLTGTGFEAVLAHEMGHCLGFRHSNQPQMGQVTVTSDALMNSIAPGGGAVLRGWDRDAASHVYGSGASSCTPPSINAQPQSTTITAGQSTTLSVGASGTSPAFQWFIGSPPGSAIPGATGSSVTVSPSGTTNYFVVATNGCGTATSNVATVTVNPATCPSVTVATPTVAQNGSSFILLTTASGGTITAISWFQGVPGAATFLGSGNSITVTPATPTTYFAQATNSCGNSANSATVTVNPAPACTPPFITQHPASATIAPGQSVNLSVASGGTSPVGFQWFTGSPGGGTPLAGATGNSVTVTPATTSTYFVIATNACGSATSAVATITVTPAPCPAPAVSQPPNQTIVAGLSTTITVNATGSGLSFQWFRGASGDTSSPVGTNAPALSTGPLNQTTPFWVRVTNSCGATAATQTITIATQVGRRRATRG